MKVVYIPEVLLLIPPQYLPIIPNKVRYINQPILLRLRILLSLHNSPGYDTYIMLLGQGPILVEIRLPLIADVAEARVVGYPVCEMVFGEDSELGAT